MEKMHKLINYGFQVQKQQVIVNGNASVVEKRILVLSCPTCNIPFFSEGFTGSIGDFLKALEQQNDFINYCPRCGQPLSIPTLVEAEGKENGKE